MRNTCASPWTSPIWPTSYRFICDQDHGHLGDHSQELEGGSVVRWTGNFRTH